MAKKAAAAVVANPGTVTASMVGSEDLIGNVVALDNGAFEVTYKVPRSPKTVTELLAKGSYIAAQEGENGFITKLGRIELVSLDVEDIRTNVVFEDDGSVTVTSLDADGEEVETVIYPNPLVTIEVVGDPVKIEKDDAPAAKKAPAKAKAEPAAEAAPKGKKAKAEPVEEEEEEAEEAPKAKKKKAAPAEEEAPKGKKKAKESGDW